MFVIKIGPTIGGDDRPKSSLSFSRIDEEAGVEEYLSCPYSSQYAQSPSPRIRPKHPSRWPPSALWSVDNSKSAGSSILSLMFGPRIAMYLVGGCTRAINPTGNWSVPFSTLLATWFRISDSSSCPRGALDRRSRRKDRRCSSMRFTSSRFLSAAVLSLSLSFSRCAAVLFVRTNFFLLSGFLDFWILNYFFFEGVVSFKERKLVETRESWFKS